VPPKPPMTADEHRARHVALHRGLDELCADYLAVTGRLLSDTTVMELVAWSHRQTTDPELPPGASHGGAN
jgi:hypothetical protein